MKQPARRKKAADPAAADPMLEALPGPAAVFDLALQLEHANAAFLALCVSGGGRGLAELLPPAGATPVAPRDGERCDYLARSADAMPVLVSLARHGERVGALAHPSGVAQQQLGAAVDALGERGRAQSVLLALTREVALAASEDELVAAIARSLRQLFPGRFFCVRIVEPRHYTLSSMYAEGRLIEEGKERLALRRAAAEKAQLDLRSLPDGVLTLTEQEPLIFAGAIRGFATPLVAAGQLFGILNLEYPQGLAVDAHADEKLLIQLANQAAVGVRNAKLIEELSFVKRYLEELIENANALIFMVDRHQKLLVFNRAMVELSANTRAEVIGKDVLPLIAESEREKVRSALERSLRGEPVDNQETLLLRKDGAEVRVTYATTPVVNASGEVEAVMGIGHDITRQKELERRVVQAEKLATLGQLAAGVAHEINNPLTTITMYAESLLQLAMVRRGEPGDVDKLKRIRESAERILKFAHDLTSYARPAQDKPEDLDPHNVLDQAVRYCEHALKQSKARLEKRYAETLPGIRGVRANLVQVFVNLVTNACHALPADGGDISLTTRAAACGVEILIHDNGRGIERTMMPKIFDPFFTTKAEGKGTGLGLTIVQGIVEKHGGTVRAESEKGAGTTFVVWLPTTAAE